MADNTFNAIFEFASIAALAIDPAREDIPAPIPAKIFNDPMIADNANVSPQSIFTLLNPIKIKSCFIGACASEYSSKLILNYIPYFLEFIISFGLISFSIIIMFISKKKDKSYIKALILEFLYISLNFSNSITQFIKAKNNSEDRYDEYGSIHDYITIIRSALLIVFCIHQNDIKEWYILLINDKSISYTNIEKDNKEIDRIVHSILSYKI